MLTVYRYNRFVYLEKILVYVKHYLCLFALKKYIYTTREFKTLFHKYYPLVVVAACEGEL